MYADLDLCLKRGWISVRMDGKAILDAIIALILYIVFAMIYFIILAFVVKFATNIFFDYSVGADAVAMGAAILAGATIVAGGGLADAFKKEVIS